MNGSFAITDLRLYTDFVYFIICVFLSCYLPGTLLLKSYKFDWLTKVFLSVVLGMVLWGMQGYIFGYLNARYLSYVYLLIIVLIWFYHRRLGTKDQIPRFKFTKKSFWLWLLIGLGGLTQLLQIWYSGVLVPNGMYFCCGIDSVYHLSLTGEVVRNFPPFDPGTVATTVKNYHYFSNVIVAEWVRVFGLPLIATYFQFAPVLISFFLGIGAYVFAKTVKFSEAMIRWLLFFLYFSGSGVYFLILLFTKKINFASIFLHDASLLWASPPRVYAIVIFFAGITLLSLWIQKKKLFLGIVSAIVMASLVSIKVYFGFFALVGFGFLSFYFLIKKDFKSLLPFGILLALAAFLYIPVNNQAGGLVFTGLWRVENFISYPPLGLLHLEELRNIYVLHHNIPRQVLFESFYILLYFVGIFWTLLLGFAQTKKSLRVVPIELHIFLWSGLFASIICGLFFIQQVGGSNSSQFIITALQILPIFTAIAVATHLSRIQFAPLKIGLLIALILLTVPRVAYDTVNTFQENRVQGGYLLSTGELKALSFLNTQHPGVVLSPEKDCLYLRIFTSSQIYYCNDAKVLTDHAKNLNTDATTNVHLDNYANLEAQSLQKMGINYIYIRKKEHYPKEQAKTFNKMYENNEILILLLHSPKT